MLQVWMQMRAFDPEKCGSGKKTERVLKGNAWATGIYLSGCGVGARKMLHKSSSSLRTPTPRLNGIQCRMVLTESPF